MSGPEYLMVPREGVSDDSVELIDWLEEDRSRVEQGTPVVDVETSKAVFTLEAHRAGFLIHMSSKGSRVRVGDPIAMITDKPRSRPNREIPEDGTPLISKKAALLMQQDGITREDFPGFKVIRAQDVTDFVSRFRVAKTQQRCFAGAPLDPDFDWDSVLSESEYQQFRELTTQLRRRMKARFHRHVPTGTLLYDRWDLARDYEFGEGTSLYDECLILGNVHIGKHCWIGPFTVLDGAWAPLTIGDYTQIGSGSQVYTHNTIEHVLTGNKAEAFKRATTIGSCCFISPMSVIGPGSIIGDHSFVATSSFVQGEFPDHSYIAGSPARLVGTVEVDGNQARLRLDDSES